MKLPAKTVATAALLAFSTAIFADDVSVRGYYRADGSYVAPTTRSAPNGNPYDNYSNSPDANSTSNSNPYNAPSQVYIPQGSNPRNAWMYDNRPCAHSADPRKGQILGQNNCGQ